VAGEVAVEKVLAPSAAVAGDAADGGQVHLRRLSSSRCGRMVAGAD
jgi:hypothetical protein